MPKKKIVVVDVANVVKTNNKPKNKKKNKNFKNKGVAFVSANPNRNTVPQMRLQNSAFMEAVCSIYDPFCPAAQGARYSDKYPTRTITYQSRLTVNVSTGTSGTGVVVFAPDNTAGVFFKLTADGTTPALYSAYDANYVSALTQASQMRIVSAGAKFVSTMAATSAKAVVIVGTFNNTNYLNKSWTIGSNFSDYEDFAITNSDKEFIWVAKAQQAGATELNVPIGTNVRTGFWDGLAIEVLNGPTNSFVGVLEVVINVEYTLTADASSVSNQMGEIAKPVADYNVWESAMQYMRNTTSSIFEGSARAFTNYAKGKAMQAVSLALNSNPYTKPVGMLMDTYRYSNAREVD